MKAKAEPAWRFWGLYVHVCKRETLWEAYRLARANDGAPGSDGVTFAAVEEQGLEGFLDQLREELVERTYRPQAARKVEIPKGNGKMRQLWIPSIRDRVVQGALTRISHTSLVGVEASASVRGPVGSEAKIAYTPVTCTVQKHGDGSERLVNDCIACCCRALPHGSAQQAATVVIEVVVEAVRAPQPAVAPRS